MEILGKQVHMDLFAVFAAIVLGGIVIGGLVASLRTRSIRRESARDETARAAGGVDSLEVRVVGYQTKF